MKIIYTYYKFKQSKFLFYSPAPPYGSSPGSAMIHSPAGGGGHGLRPCGFSMLKLSGFIIASLT